MNHSGIRYVATLFLAAASIFAVPAATAAHSEIVLHTKDAVRIAGDWQKASDTGAASGVRLWNPERGRAKASSAAAAPLDYFELTFTAEAGRAYRLWMRGKAESDHWANDSVFVQFSGTVTSSGSPIFRIGTTGATWFGVEACSGCGLSAWGWEDNAFGADAPLVYFAATGPQTIRIQRREDGVSIDQIVLSSSTYLTTRPGATKNDKTILPATQSSTTATTSSTSAAEILVSTANLTATAGAWKLLSDSTAAGGHAVGHPNQGLVKVSEPLASPAHYADFTFSAEAGRSYRLWIRGKADGNSWANDSVFVQFTGSISSTGSATARIGTTSAYMVNLEEDSGWGLSEWGWQDNGYGAGVLGPLVMFSTSGTQKMRIQTREDGLRMDQIVLSSSTYLNTAPGALKNDTTILLSSTTPTTSSTTTATTSTTTTTTTTTSTTTTTASGTVRLRVLQWNLHHGVGTDGVYDIERIASWMAAMKPDVILLNEVEKYTSWGNEDQPARYKAMLEHKTGRRWYSHFSQEFGAWNSNGKGHQILSTYPFDVVSHATITQSSGLGGAGAVSQATITVNGRTVNFVLSHLDPYDKAMRLIQAQDVIRYAASFAENRIVGGDMNAWPDQTSILEYYKTYNDSWSMALSLGTAYAPADISPYGATKKGRIDYILSSKQASNLAVLESRVYDTRDAKGYMPSDHRPVLTTFEVR